MAQIINIITIGFLWYLSLSIVFARQPIQVCQYMLSSSKSIRLEPNLNKTLITITANAFLSLINKTQGNTFSIILRNVDIAVQRENAVQIDFPNCTSSQPAIDALSQPFLASYDETGVLNHVRLNKNEPELSKNFKLYGATLLQVDFSQILGVTPPVENRLERFYTGLCPVTTVLSKDAKGNIGIVKTSDFTRCDEVVNDHRSDSLNCLKHTCGSTVERSLQWTATSNLLARQTSNETVVQTVTLVQQASYRPYQNSSQEIVIESITGTNLMSMGPFNELPPLFQESPNAVDMSLPVYRTVNKEICEEEIDTDIDGFGEVYSALVCEQSFAVIYEDIIERAIQCDKN